MPKSPSKSYDVIIIGAGPAGIFCTLKLLDAGIRNILVIGLTPKNWSRF